MSLCVAPFAPEHEEAVIRLIVGIQRDEFGIDITAEQQPDLRRIPDFYQRGCGNFWVALSGGRVVGTVSLLDIGDERAALRKMFVKKDHRGPQIGAAHLLLDVLLSWARERGVGEIFLGTTPKLRAAHRFYEKNGFDEIAKSQLPASFPIMEVDTKFYAKRLARTSPAALAHRLAALLEARAPAGSSIALSALRAGARPVTVWTPTSESEPRFLAYSITKVFIAALMLMLAEERRLRLDDPLARWFPALDGAERVTLRRVLNHSAGIRDYGGLADYHQAVRTRPSDPWSFEEFAERTLARGLLFEPGQGWIYSNPGYMLMRAVVEQAGGAELGDLIEDRLAAPLGLRRTSIARTVGDLAPLAPAFSRAVSDSNEASDVRTSYHPGWVFHGVLISTATEIATFLDAIFAGRLLSRDSLAEMTTPIEVPREMTGGREGRPSYGLGLMGNPESRFGRLWGHNGGGPGYSASAFYAPDLPGGPASACAMCAVEDESLAEGLVQEALAALDGG